MSLYAAIGRMGPKFFPKNKLFRHGFNLSPMYRRSTGRIIYTSEDLHQVTIRIKLSWKNKNYVNSIFGGSMFSAVDPIPMVQLINILGEDYVVWDKRAGVQFLRPAKEHLYADFTYSEQDIATIKEQVSTQKEIEWKLTTQLTNKAQDKVFCEIEKTLYVADKAFYKEKRSRKKTSPVEG